MSEQQAPGEDGSDGEREHPLHDMGGDIGPVSIRGSSARDQGGAAADAAPHSGYARDMGPMAGSDEDQPEISGGIEGGDLAPPVVAGAPSNYLEIDEGGDQSGRGADGSLEARLEQKRSGEL